MSNFKVHEATLWAPDEKSGGRRAMRVTQEELAALQEAGLAPPGQGSNTVYNLFKAAIMGAPTSGTTTPQINLLTDTIKIMLLTSAYTVAPEHDFISDISANELTVSGYTGGFNGAGRKALASRTVVLNDTSDAGVFDAADPSAWTLAAGETIGGAAIVKELTNDAASPLICYLAFTNTPTNGGTVTVSFNAAGILTLS